MPEISEEELAKYRKAEEDNKVNEASKKRLEDENSKIKLRAKDAEDKLTAAEKKKLEDDGKTSDLLVLEQKKSAQLEEDLEKRTKSVLAEKVRTEILKHAKDAHDVDMILKVADHKDLLKIDKEALTITGAEEFVGKVRETHAFLFSGKKMPDYDNKKKGDGSGEDDDHDKTDDERYRTELQKCDTRKEMNDVRKKFGKEVDTY